MAPKYQHTPKDALKYALKSLWAEAFNWATYLRNRLPHSAPQGKAPYEVMYNKRPTIGHLHPFYTKCYATIPEPKRGSGPTLEPRAHALESHLTGFIIFHLREELIALGMPGLYLQTTCRPLQLRLVHQTPYQQYLLHCPAGRPFRCLTHFAYTCLFHVLYGACNGSVAWNLMHYKGSGINTPPLSSFLCCLCLTSRGLLANLIAGFLVTGNHPPSPSHTLKGI